MYADIIVDITHEKLDKVFQYRIPSHLEGMLKVGMEVVVPFGMGNKEIKGYVTGFSERAEYAPEKMKEVLKIAEESVAIESKLVALAAWMKESYGGTMIQALKTVLPIKKKEKAKEKQKVRLLLPEAEGNVGAIFRSAAALHMDAVILTGGCSNPLYRRASRVSMGTVFQIPWTFVDNSVIWPEEGMKILRELGFKTAAMALKEDSASIDDPELMKEDKLAVILGTEGDGLAPETIADCDYTVMIPMSHGVDSLNVAAASAVAFWQLGKR